MTFEEWWESSEGDDIESTKGVSRLAYKAGHTAGLTEGREAGMSEAEEVARDDAGKWRGPAGEACAEGAIAAADAIARARSRSTVGERE